MESPLSPADLAAAQRAILSEISQAVARNQARASEIEKVKATAISAADRQAKSAIAQAKTAVGDLAGVYDKARSLMGRAGYRFKPDLPSPSTVRRPEQLQIADLEAAAKRVAERNETLRSRVLLNPGTSNAVRPRAGCGQVFVCTFTLLLCTGPFFLVHMLTERFGSVSAGSGSSVSSPFYIPWLATIFGDQAPAAVAAFGERMDQDPSAALTMIQSMV